MFSAKFPTARATQRSTTTCVQSHLEGEVHVTGGVNDVDAVVLPCAGGGSRGDGDPALTLLRQQQRLS